MALCTACDQLARTLSAYSGIQMKEAQHSKAASLLTSAKHCRLCKYLISCVGSEIYPSATRHGHLTVQEHLILNYASKCRLTYCTGLAPSYCHFRVYHKTDEGGNQYLTGFDLIFWAHDGTSQFWV